MILKLILSVSFLSRAFSLLFSGTIGVGGGALVYRQKHGEASRSTALTRSGLTNVGSLNKRRFCPCRPFRAALLLPRGNAVDFLPWPESTNARSAQCQLMGHGAL